MENARFSLICSIFFFFIPTDVGVIFGTSSSNYALGDKSRNLSSAVFVDHALGGCTDFCQTPRTRAHSKRRTSEPCQSRNLGVPNSGARGQKTAAEGWYVRIDRRLRAKRPAAAVSLLVRTSLYNCKLALPMFTRKWYTRLHTWGPESGVGCRLSPGMEALAVL